LGSEAVALRIVLLRHWMEMIGYFHAAAALSQRKSLWYPLDRSLGGPQDQSGRGGEENNSQPLPGLEAPIIQRYTTELSRFLCTRNLSSIVLNQLPCL